MRDAVRGCLRSQLDGSPEEVDLDHMAGLLARPAADFLPDLRGLVFLHSQTRQWETDDQYLSGNVREKLAVAEAAAITDAAFASNVEEQLDLTKNQAPSQAESVSQDVAEKTTEKQSATSLRSHRGLRVAGQGIRPTRRSTIRVWTAVTNARSGRWSGLGSFRSGPLHLAPRALVTG